MLAILVKITATSHFITDAQISVAARTYFADFENIFTGKTDTHRSRLNRHWLDKDHKALGQKMHRLVIRDLHSEDMDIGYVAWTSTTLHVDTGQS